MPRLIKPMLATLAAEAPSHQDDYGFEFKWDGVRAVAYFDRGKYRILSRNDLEITARYPELEGMKKIFSTRRAVLDGEIIAVDENGWPSFPVLQQRIHANPQAARQLMSRIPVSYVLFDVLYLDGQSTLSQPYERRRKLLEGLKLAGEHWQMSPMVVGEGNSVIKAAKQSHMEGVVAKRLVSRYEPGRRSPHWLKIKFTHRQEFVVGGWRTEHGSPRNVGSLLLGYHDAKTGALHYAGMLGTGFTQKTLAEMEKELGRRKADDNPFVEKIPGSTRGRCEIHYVNPNLVIEAEYRRWPRDGMVQQASFKGIREDKPAKQVVREEPVWK
ncbi:MAG TPA: non-homologous end-joining DNA ligase [Tepidisphaeraceae bacterium]|nr:non-homologous end-joining DNA ligase [Tepidisphaeraceae bacterium]